MPFDLSGKRAIVTGGANGIGLATARALAEGSAEVWIFDLERPMNFAGQFLAVDVTDPASISAALDCTW